MSQILLNILIFVGSQQFILGAQYNEKLKTKLGFYLSCYEDNSCTHDIYDTYEEENQNNCPENYPNKCVKQIYSVCSKGHTMCGQCIYASITNGIKNKEGTINCFYCDIDPKKKFGKKIFNHVMNQLIGK